MSKGIIGKKLGMTTVFTQEGRSVPVTVIQAGPCTVTQVKTVGTDGYDALQLGFGNKKSSRVNKPMKGHFAKAGENLFAVLREVGVDKPEEFELGQEITVNLFSVGEKVDVIGYSKGRGFSGVVKRHGFHGGGKTHGCKSHAVPGSIGTSAWPSRVLKGKKLPGHYGVERNTIKNVEVVDIRPELNIILLKGAVPGPISGTVMVNMPERANK